MRILAFLPFLPFFSSFAAPGNEVNQWPIAQANLISKSIYHRSTSFPSHISSNRWFITRIFQIWSMQVGYGELAGGSEPIRNGEIFLMINKKNYVDLRVCYSVTPSYNCVTLHSMLRGHPTSIFGKCLF